MILQNCWYHPTNTSSTYTRTRGMTMQWPKQPSRWEWFYRSNWYGWAPSHFRGISTYLRQRQRWSLMTLLYLGVRSSRYKCGRKVVLTWKYPRRAILEYCMPCMFGSSSNTVVVLMNHLLWSVFRFYVCLFKYPTFISSDRWHTVNLPTISVTNVMSLLYQSLPLINCGDL